MNKDEFRYRNREVFPWFFLIFLLFMFHFTGENWYNLRRMDKEREDKTSLSDLRTGPDVSLERSLQGRGSWKWTHSALVNVPAYCCHKVIVREDLVSHILKSSWTSVCSQIIKYPEEPASRVELLQVSPVEAGGVIHLPVRKNLRHIRGPLQRVVSH